MRRALLITLTLVLAATSLGVLAPPADASSGDEQAFFSLMNQARTSRGLAPMALNSVMSNDARGWSGTMSSRNLLFHTSNHQMVTEIARVVPDWRRVGENVGVGYGIETLHDAFMNSPGHRANVLGDFNQVGIGVVRSGNRIWVTFRFAKGSAVAGTSGSASFGKKTPFIDVRDDAYYTGAVAWLARKGVTTGTSNRLFGPDDPVTRGQMATFLWRLAGQPRASAARFIDVPPSAYYAPAVEWMRAKGLTNGVGNTNRFDPNGTVTREQMAAFLHRFAGDKRATSRHPFHDVARSSYADGPVSWLHQYRVTTGTGPNTFNPRGPVTRAQMAAFLHRLATTSSAMGSGAIRIRV